MARTFKIGGGWGDRIEWSTPLGPNQVNGWKTPLPQVGDSLEAPMQSGKTGVYRFDDVRPCRDPRDMFFATVSFVGYVTE